MSRRRWWIAAVLILALVLSVVLGSLALPRLARWLVVRQIETLTGRPVTVERFELDLARGRLGIAGFRLADREPGPPLAEFQRLEARFDSRALLRGQLEVREATLDGPRLRIIRTEGGDLNIADLLGREARERSIAVTVDRFRLIEGVVTLEDRTMAPPRTWQAESITVEASGLSTVHAEARGTARLAATVTGSPLSADVAELRLAPLHARGRLSWRDVDATLAGIYLPPDAAVVLQQGLLSADLAATVDAREGLRLEGQGRLDKIVLRQRGVETPIVTAPSLVFDVIGARVPGSPPRLDRLEVNGAATLFDTRASPPTRFEIDRIRLRVEATGESGSSPARVNLSAGLPAGGALDADGTAHFDPFGAALRARVARLDLAPSPSVLPGSLRLTGTADGEFAVDLSYSGGVATRLRGLATASRVTVADAGGEIVSAQQVEVTGVEAEGPRLRVGRVRVARPTMAVRRDGAGHMSPAVLFTASAGPQPSGSREKPSTSTASALAVEIGEIVVDDGALAFQDEAVTPRAQLQLSSLRLTAREVTWPARRPVKVQLTTATPGAGTLDADGTVSLDPGRLDLRARLVGAALAPYQAYVPLSARIQGRLDAEVAVSGALGGRAAIGVRGMATLSGLAIADGDRPLLTVGRVETTGLDYAWPGTMTIDRLHVQKSWALIERRADGGFPLRALFTPVGSSVPARSGPVLSGGAPAATLDVKIRESVLEDGSATIADGAVRPASRIELTGVSLVAREFTWPARGPTTVRLRAPMPGGGSVTAEGELALGSSSLDLRVMLGGVDLGPARPYLPLRGRIGGKASGDLQVKGTFDPLTIAARGTASLGDLALADGDRTLLKVGRLEVTGLDYAWPAKVTIDRLHLEKPWAMVERRPDGAFPLRRLLTPVDAGPVRAPDVHPPSPGALPVGTLDVTIRETVADDGSATILDGGVSPAFRSDLARVGLVVHDLTWPARGPTTLQLQAALPGGGSVSARGPLDLTTRSADLKIVLSGVDMAPAGPYLPGGARIAGRASGDLQVKGRLEPLAITARGTASLAALTVADGDRPLLTAARLETTGLDYTWPTTVTVDRLRAEKPWALLERRADGGAPVPAVVAAVLPGAAGKPAASAARSTASGSAPSSFTTAGPLALRVRRGVLENGGVTIVDGRGTPGARLDMAGGSLIVRNFAWPPQGATGVVLRMPAADGGRLEARGQVRLDRSSVDATVVLDRFDLGAARPYLPDRWSIAGKADGELKVQGSLAPLAVSVLGQVGVADAALGDGHRTLLSVKRVDMTGVSAEWPRRLAIERIGLQQPWCLVERNPDGSLVLLSLAAPAADGSSTPRGASSRAGANGSGETARLVEVGALTVEGGFIRFVDHTTSPRFVEEASSLAATARGLGTTPASRSQVSVTGRLTGGAPFELSGVVGPLGGPLSLDMQGKLSQFPLPRANPYANRLIGWIARRGAVDARLAYRVRDGRLDAGNEVVLGQPEFVPSRRGDEVRERVGLPLDLLVSLLKNARNEVHLSLPITGDISTGQLDFSESVWDALRRAAISVLALPVSWVGKVFYTADSRIDTIRIWPVSFEPGTTRMRRDIDAHAQRLATFLRDAPAVVLAMKPVMTVEDVSVLKRDAARQRIDALALQGGEPVLTVAARLFAERFPGRPAPPELETIVSELAATDPVPDSAVRALAATRVELTRSQLLARGGLDPQRLRVSEGVVPVEAAGAGRVEFEIIP